MCAALKRKGYETMKSGTPVPGYKKMHKKKHAEYYKSNTYGTTTDLANI
jgi:hypothetical protein